MDDKNHVKKFLEDLKSQSFSNEEIIKKYPSSRQLSNEALEMQNLLLNDLRKIVSGTDYSVFNRSEKPDSFRNLESSANPNSQFAIIQNGKAVAYLLVENGKIISLSTMNKGGRRYFIIN